VTLAPSGSNSDAFWMPFTPHRAFRANPRMFSAAEGAYYRTQDGRQVLDSIAGLWCVNAGHAQPHIVRAIQEQAARLDFVSCFNMGHAAAFELASRIAALAPASLDHVFFVNSGSEACDTALKIARAYQRAIGQGQRTLLVGRERAYHGVGWGGQSVGGLAKHRRDFSPMLGQTAHLPLPYDREVSAFSWGQPEHGAHYADALLDLMVVHDPSTIAAVIVEPVVGSGGVFPPPKGYLQRLREICDAHGILLIFDEVITGFGRLGTPFAAEALGVTPDLITCAKGMTNGAVPMGGVIVSDRVFQAFLDRPDGGIEFLHGYTYSAHPLACAAGLATLDVYRDQDLFNRAGRMAEPWGGRPTVSRASATSATCATSACCAASTSPPGRARRPARAAAR